MKNVFYFILKAFFVFNILVVWENSLIRKLRLINILWRDNLENNYNIKVINNYNTHIAKK